MGGRGTHPQGAVVAILRVGDRATLPPTPCLAPAGIRAPRPLWRSDKINFVAPLLQAQARGIVDKGLLKGRQ
jgi:hypothetical protein